MLKQEASKSRDLIIVKEEALCLNRSVVPFNFTEKASFQMTKEKCFRRVGNNELVLVDFCLLNLESTNRLQNQS